MKLCIILSLLAVSNVYCLPQGQGVTLNAQQVKYLQHKGFGATKASPFRPTVAYVEEDEEYDDNEPEQSQDRQPTYANYPIPVRTTLPKAYPSASPKNYVVPSKHQQQYRKGEQSNKLEDEDKEKEEEEPDRLSVLLPQSRFNCQTRTTGYYADEELGCEVFHYCQENAKHSWICPEGFTFHQVHLICMPPGGDNICEKSADYHFVNEYLYKPVNLEEYQHKPNITLRYSDRYFPNAYRTKNEDGEGLPRHQHSIRVTGQPQLRASVSQPRYSPTTLRPQVTVGQVFRSPEEINISLQQRRPQQYTTAGYDDDYRK